MRIDHVSFAAGPEGLDAAAARLGEALGIEVVDGGNHPRFGTRNMVLPLADGRWVEVVEPLEHPVTDKVPFGQAVKARSEAGGGWLGWVVAMDDLSPVEERLGRDSVLGNRHRPDGTELTWRQIGVKGLIADPQLPFFLRWDEGQKHPSEVGPSTATLASLQVAGDPGRVRDWLGLSGEPGTDREDWEPEVGFDFVAPNGTPGLLSVTFQTQNGPVTV
ncbi:VOC family protein [Kytococcus sedentarius]|uniref:VOC family protein n=1 Tax=Kytococcus sedentarius TaxID=1276 RepID=UPI00384DD15A